MPSSAGLRCPSCLTDAAQALDVMQFGDQPDFRTCDDRQTEAHLIHPIVHQHLDIIHLNDLVPHIGQQRQGQIPMGNGTLVLALLLGTLHIHVYPLVVEGSVCK